MSGETIEHMRNRIEWCRQLAKTTTDRTTAEALRKIADEIAADVAHLETHGGFGT